jgi:hypothetical protein
MNRIIFAVLLCVSPTLAFAYLDPGTGSLLIQAAIGALAAITVFWGNLKVYVRSFFSRGEVDKSRTDLYSDESAGDSKRND